MLSGDVAEVLDWYPDIRDALDERALSSLARADVDRAVEIINEIGAKEGVRNPSAFVASALAKFPKKRGRPEDIDTVLGEHPDIILDEAAIEQLKSADPARAVEVIREIASKGDVRNPSAFVSVALGKYPHKRGSIEENQRQERSFAVERTNRIPHVHTARISWPLQPMRQVPYRATHSPLDRVLARHPEIVLDEAALDRLYTSAADRAVEIIQDIVAKGDVRNPSAFVSQALRSHPEKRGDPVNLEQALARRPAIAQALDSKALESLRRADPARAVEIIEDVAAKPDVRNPSAFVAKALTAHPQKRGYEETFGWSPHPLPPLVAPKRFRAAPGPVMYDRYYEFGTDNLDEEARRRLAEADPERAQEVLEELADKGDTVRNPSAFVARSLQQYPRVRGRRYPP